VNVVEGGNHKCHVRRSENCLTKGRGSQNGDQMGMNELSTFIYNASKWGYMGMNHVSPLEMGDRGEG
jgi:hypothetical protein